MKDSLTVIMFCQVLQMLVIFSFCLVWLLDKCKIKDCVQINVIKDRNEDRQEVIHCGGSPATGWCGECEYGLWDEEKGYFMCFASDIDGVETVGRIKPKEKNDACD